jgi:hypothetical protein
LTVVASGKPSTVCLEQLENYKELEMELTEKLVELLEAAKNSNKKIQVRKNIVVIDNIENKVKSTDISLTDFDEAGIYYKTGNKSLGVHKVGFTPWHAVAEIDFPKVSKA